MNILAHDIYFVFGTEFEIKNFYHKVFSGCFDFIDPQSIMMDISLSNSEYLCKEDDAKFDFVSTSIPVTAPNLDIFSLFSKVSLDKIESTYIEHLPTLNIPVLR